MLGSTGTSVLKCTMGLSCYFNSATNSGAFSFNTYCVDGHNISELVKAFHEAAGVKGRPTCIIAKTFKGKNIPGRTRALRVASAPMLNDRAIGCDGYT